MPIWDTFAKRQKRLLGEVSDVYTYDDLPGKLRIQIIHLITEGIGEDIDGSRNRKIYAEIVRIMRHELGKFQLHEEAWKGPATEIANYILQEKDADLCLTAVELSFRLIDVFVRKNWSDICYGGYSPKIMPDDAIDSLNIRFKEASVGYQYVSGEIIRVDSEILHSEAVKPALSLLRDKRYNGANDEFLSAHAHYRNGKYKECLTDCTKAFESTMKVICDKRKWTYASGDTANKLVNVILENCLIDKYWQTHFTSLSSMLSSGIPTPRNKTAAHGQG